MDGECSRNALGTRRFFGGYAMSLESEKKEIASLPWHRIIGGVCCVIGAVLMAWEHNVPAVAWALVAAVWTVRWK